MDTTHFIVTAFGESFASDARCPSELQDNLFPGRGNLRCWVRTDTPPSGFVWLEMPLNGNTCVFDAIRPLVSRAGGSGVVITFRETKESPLSSLSSSSDDDDGSVEQCHIEGLVNDKDPFSLEPLAEVKDLLYL